jgi:uncharacterized membrane protein YeaQ/YmgE (transglycosylase-associated protein family)
MTDVNQAKAAVLLVDTVSIRDLFAGGGAAMWDQLLKGSDSLVISRVIVDEINAIDPSDPGYPVVKAFNDWISDNKINIVEYKIPGTYGPDGRPLKDAGENTLIALANRENNPAVKAALEAAGIPTDTGAYRILTDDTRALDKIAKATGSTRGNFLESGLEALGWAEDPYYGTAEFLAERRAVGDLDQAGLKSWIENFKNSGRNIASGKNIDIQGGWKFNLQAQFQYLENNIDNEFGEAWDALRPFLKKLINSNEGSVSPHFALKGGVLAGVGAIASKVGIIGDILAFSATVAAADELRKKGEVSKANELWVEYLYQTGGGILGAILGAAAATYALKGKGGVWAPIVAGLVGSVAGSLGGAALGQYLYEHNPQFFDGFINEIYSLAGGGDLSAVFLENGTLDLSSPVVQILTEFGFSGQVSQGGAASDWLLATKWQEVSGEAVMILYLVGRGRP